MASSVRAGCNAARIAVIVTIILGCLVFAFAAPLIIGTGYGGGLLLFPWVVLISSLRAR